VRVDVAMVATKASRSGRVLMLVLMRPSGEFVERTWRDKQQRFNTIKVVVDVEPGRSDRKCVKSEG
jgi:hypothetical protein